MAARPAGTDYVPVPLPIGSNRLRGAKPSRRAIHMAARRGAAEGGLPSMRRAASVQPLVAGQALPLVVRNLSLLQRGSSVVLFVLSALTLGVYSRTVHSQRVWSEAYSELALLRRQEPQLTLANETLKQHLADNAEQPDSGLVNPDPFNALFLEPASPRPLLNTPEAVAPEVPQLEIPLSY